MLVNIYDCSIWFKIRKILEAEDISCWIQPVCYPQFDLFCLLGKGKEKAHTAVGSAVTNVKVNTAGARRTLEEIDGCIP